MATLNAPRRGLAASAKSLPTFVFVNSNEEKHTAVKSEIIPEQYLRYTNDGCKLSTEESPPFTQAIAQLKENFLRAGVKQIEQMEAVKHHADELADTLVDSMQKMMSLADTDLESLLKAAEQQTEEGEEFTTAHVAMLSLVEYMKTLKKYIVVDGLEFFDVFEGCELLDVNKAFPPAIVFNMTSGGRPIWHLNDPTLKIRTVKLAIANIITTALRHLSEWAQSERAIAAYEDAKRVAIEAGKLVDDRKQQLKRERPQLVQAQGNEINSVYHEKSELLRLAIKHGVLNESVLLEAKEELLIAGLKAALPNQNITVYFAENPELTYLWTRYDLPMLKLLDASKSALNDLTKSLHLGPASSIEPLCARYNGETVQAGLIVKGVFQVEPHNSPDDVFIMLEAGA